MGGNVYGLKSGLKGGGSECRAAEFYGCGEILSKLREGLSGDRYMSELGGEQ